MTKSKISALERQIEANYESFRSLANLKGWGIDNILVNGENVDDAVEDWQARVIFNYTLKLEAKLQNLKSGHK